jgi:FKBP-type peptidyl-prolyl cis-trans isomerase
LHGERERVSYVIGLDAARQIAPVKDEVDVEIAVAALRSSLAGKAPLLDDAEQQKVRADFSRRLAEQRAARSVAAAADNLAAADRFLAENAGRAGVQRLPSGLQYEVLRAGSGATPGATDTVRVNYVARLPDGSAYESTYSTDHPAEFALNRVMPGLAEALAHMQVGAKHRVWIAPQLAYGDHGVPGQIEPNTLLTFEIELLEVAGK